MTGVYRLVVGGGEMLRAAMSFTGTSGVLRFDLAHRRRARHHYGRGLGSNHIPPTYGDYVDELLALARMLDLPVLRLA